MPELDQETIQRVKQSPSLKARALRLLSLREYSRKELAIKLLESANKSEKLAKRQQTEESQPFPEKSIENQIEEVLDDFEARGWLSDQRFAEALVRRKSERYGVRKISEDLQRAGVDGSKAVDLIQELRDSEYQRAKALWLKKFGVLAKDQKERAKQYRFLASKGFSSELVSKIIGGRFD